MPVVGVVVAVSGACSLRSVERQVFKVLAGSPLAVLVPFGSTLASASLAKLFLSLYALDGKAVVIAATEANAKRARGRRERAA